MSASSLQRLPEVDRRAIRWLADQLASGMAGVSRGELAGILQTDIDVAGQVLQRMLQLGAIEDCSHEFAGRTRIEDLRITPVVFQLQEALETPPDRVAEFLAMLRSQESTYRWLIAATGTAFTLGAVNQFFELLEHLSKLFGGG